MKREIMVTNTTETLTKIEVLILDDLRNNQNDFLQIIRNPEYQFSTGLSFRMLNYYENESMLRAKRNSKQGKRRISFFDLHVLKFLIANRQKTSKLERLDFNDLIEVVMPELSEGNIAPSIFEIHLMVALVCLGLRDVNLTTKYTEVAPHIKPYNLSEGIRDSFSNLDLTLLRNQEFITKLIYEVDRLRLSLGLQILSNENLLEMGQAPFITQVHRNRALEALQFYLKSPLINEFKNHSHIYRHDNGMVYGMEIKQLGHEDSLTPEDRTQFSLSINEIIIKTK
jgi:hypothetical protein